MKVRSFFAPGWTVAWVTTYTFDLDAFEGHLFGKLGGPPLNATILADQDRIESVWEQLVADGDTQRMGRTGRHYLVRGVEWRRAFHPKTYLFGRRERGRLLVGSGNCGLNGLLDGNEVMSLFRSEDEDGLAAIRSWRQWMARLLHQLHDPLVDERWDSLLKELPWINGEAAASAFVHNLDCTFRAQLVARAVAPVDELHLMAPFYDPNATAVADLIADLKPARIAVYAGAQTEVSGDALVQVLRRSSAELNVFRSESPVFVHAKMIGVVSGDSAWLLSGSPNLSQAALGFVAPHGNCEAATLVSASADAVRGIFREHLTWVPATLEELRALVHPEMPEELSSPSLRLLYAWITDDGRVAVTFRAAKGLNNLRLRARLEIDFIEFALTSVADDRGHQQATTEPFIDDVGQIFAVCLLADDAESGYVPIEDPVALRAFLRDPNRDHRNDPDGFSVADINSPLGRLVAWMRQNVDFSAILENMSSQRTVSRSDAGVDGTDNDDEIALEDLDILVRRRAAHRLRRMSTRTTIDDILAEIEALRSQTPGLSHPLRMVASEAHTTETVDASQSSSRWLPDRRLQVRFGNVMERTCRAVGDRREWDRDPGQAAHNIETAIEVLWACTLTKECAGFLSPERIPDLIEHLLSAVVGTVDTPGLVWHITVSEHAQLVSTIGITSRAHLAELLDAFLCPKGEIIRKRVYAWQEYLETALEIRLVDSDNKSLIQRLQQLITLNDDEHWSYKIQKRYGVSVKVMRPATVGLHSGLPERRASWLLVSEDVDVLDDQRVVGMAADWLNYETPKGWYGAQFTIAVGDPSKRTHLGGTRLSIEIGATAWLMVQTTSSFESRDIISAERLREMLRHRLAWRVVFPDLTQDRERDLGA